MERVQLSLKTNPYKKWINFDHLLFRETLFFATLTHNGMREYTVYSCTAGGAGHVPASHELVIVLDLKGWLELVQSLAKTTEFTGRRVFP
jgi:hypothetical protein